jgi:hypothetical protein
MRLRSIFLAVALLAVLPAAARAADPGRWIGTGSTSIPLYYYQGVTSDPSRNLYFDGIHVGLYRTDAQLRETARKDDAIPPAVHASENYNHIGDVTWDAAEGGRLLLPVECYYPPAGNTCKTGSIGVADPRTLDWRYYVKLDPAEIPKAMWAEVTPDGSLFWTSVDKDLLAYRTADINPGNAAPLGPRITAVRRLRNAVPPTGVTGAVFYQGRLYVAGQDRRLFQVWSIDTDTGERRLEIERNIVGESEGLDVISTLGGQLHWMIQPYNEENIPSYGVANGTLLHFVPQDGSGRGGTGGRPARPRLSLRVRPRRPRAGRRVRFSFRVTTRAGRKRRSVAGATLRFAGRRARTNRRGRARIRIRFRRSGRYRALASRRGMQSAQRWIRVRPPRKRVR